jgi:2-polyprenyl-3-methyl-5-hydroxy-6-metoxy-1,4-benzoquinol methylase
MTGDPGEIVRAGYDQVAARYRALEHDGAHWPRAEWTDKLTSRLRPGAAVLDLRTVSFPTGQFDAITSLYTFDHIPRDEHRALLERLRNWLQPGGLLLLSIEDRDEPGIVAPWLGADMYFSMFGAEATRQLVREAGFGIEETALATQTEGHTDISYTWILARKQAPAG